MSFFLVENTIKLVQVADAPSTSLEQQSTARADDLVERDGPSTDTARHEPLPEFDQGLKNWILNSVTENVGI